ncbi:hypothetical protein ACJ73_00833 [Blastomyces percursus]|uniref:Uncharacterized protein n=1 Tax=Blastomyces percursus TaxID=1658174 RepID=A0A1J9R5Z0_9EURO|nr:hypothetical protein ACJ73_00833 [Blastomyces percursus]
MTILIPFNPQLPRQPPIQHAAHAFHLVLIQRNRTGQLFQVVILEPERLAEIGALAGDLEIEPLDGVSVLCSSGLEAQLVLLVVGGDEVLDDGAGFPDGDARVWVVEGREAAVGVY